MQGQGFFEEPTIAVTQTTETVDDVEYFALRFGTNSGWDYTLQTLQNDGNWDDTMQFSGIDQSVTIPLIPTPFTPGPNPVQNLPTHLVNIQPFDSGGVYLRWVSPATGQMVTYFDSSLPNFLAAQTGFPPFVHFSDNHHFLIAPTSPALTGWPLTNPPLSQDDQVILSDFQSTYPQLSSPTQGSSVVLEAHGSGDRAVVRMAVSVKDSDRDGIPDNDEKTRGTDPFDPDSDDDDFWDGKEEADGSDPKDSSDPGTNSGSPHSTGPPEYEVRIIEVSFFENHELINDRRTVNYRDPHWVGESHSYPISYQRSEKITLSAKFSITPDPPSASASLQAPSEISLGPHVLQKVPNINNVYELKKTACDGNLPDVVKCYGKPPPEGAERKFFEIAWKVMIPDPESGEVLEYEMETEHPAYVTHGKPPSGGEIVNGVPFARILNQESLFYHACAPVDGKKIGLGNENDGKSLKMLDFVSQIYSGFQDRFVAKGVPTKPEEGRLPMYYFAATDNSGLPDKSAALGVTRAFQMLVDRHQGNGQCSAWSDLFREICKVHGNSIPVVLKTIKPANPNEDKFAIKNVVWTLPDPPRTPAFTLYPFEQGHEFKENDPDSPTGIFGQGRIDANSSHPFYSPGLAAEVTKNSSPPKIFNSHCLVQLGTTLFDPSYGTPPTTPTVHVDELRLY